MSKRLSRVEMVTKRARWSECGGGGKSRMKVVTKARKRSKGGGQERKTASRHVRKRAVQSSTARYGEEKKAEKALWCWWARTEEGAAVKSEKRGRGRAWGMKRRRGRRGGASVDGWMDGWMAGTGTGRRDGRLNPRAFQPQASQSSPIKPRCKAPSAGYDKSGNGRSEGVLFVVPSRGVLGRSEPFAN